MKKDALSIVKTAGRYAVAVLLGVLSAAPKSIDLFYLGAPALTALSPDFGLPVTATVIGQVMSVIFWSHAFRLLPTVLLLYLFSIAIKNVNKRRRSVTPGLVAVLGIFVSLACFFADTTDVAGLILYVSEAALSGCLVFFVRFYLQSENKQTSFAAISLLIAESGLLTVVEYRNQMFLFITLFTLILLCGNQQSTSDTLSVAVLILVGSAMTAFSYLPIFFIALAAVCLFRKYEKYKMLGAFLISTEICLFVLGENTVWQYLSPVAASVLYFLFPKKEVPVATPPDQPVSLSENYASLVRQVDELEHRSRITFLPESTARAAEILKNAGYLDINVTCAKDLPDGFFLDVTFTAADVVSAPALTGQMERAVGQPLSLRRFYQNNGQYYASFIRKTPFTVTCCAVCKTKNGETVCGDSAIAFGCDESHYILLLSDGMGSGKDAFMQSRWAVTLLRRLLCAGVGTGGAVSMVHSSLKLGQADPGFATVDLCSIDLSDGSAKFIKAGAVSTFILRQEEITEVTAVSLPLGAAEQADIAECRKKLLPGDIIVLVSDGALFRKNELLYTLQNRRELPAEALAKQLLKSVLPSANEKNDDDITVLVAKFDNNTKE